jgi:hypothetical protein
VSCTGPLAYCASSFAVSFDSGVAGAAVFVARLTLGFAVLLPAGVFGFSVIVLSP